MSPARLALFGACALLPAGLVVLWVDAAGARLAQLDKKEPAAAVAAATDAGYCSADLKKVLRRVLQSCGLIGKDGARGCQPLEAKTLATVSGDDFNALFRPMQQRGGIVQFDAGKAELDPNDEEMISRVFDEQRGASYFFVVARASPDGGTEQNRELSKQRAEAVLEYLIRKNDDPDLEREVGLLWLGEEFAQLDREFCDWRRSGAGPTCNAQDINRGAFLAWIDCQL
jgi:outer membrane protein OmpA-like peptidoglycan-associated protein